MGTIIAHYLERFKKFLPLETRIRNSLVPILQELIGITIERSRITFSHGTIFINTSSVIKTEIKLKQEKILSKIKESEPGLIINTIQ